MMTAYRPRQLLIILFCLWHMFAVAAYLLPTTSSLHALRDFSVPYVQSFSQWQQWNIFSPNPQRRLSVYRIERNAGDRWETALIMDFKHLAWHERAKELKILGRIQDDWKRLAPSYAASLCPRIPEASGADLRLLVETTILPSDLSSLRRISRTAQAPHASVLATVRCPLF